MVNTLYYNFSRAFSVLFYFVDYFNDFNQRKFHLKIFKYLYGGATNFARTNKIYCIITWTHQN